MGTLTAVAGPTLQALTSTGSAVGWLTLAGPLSDPSIPACFSQAMSCSHDISQLNGYPRLGVSYMASVTRSVKHVFTLNMGGYVSGGAQLPEFHYRVDPYVNGAYAGTFEAFMTQPDVEHFYFSPDNRVLTIECLPIDLIDVVSNQVAAANRIMLGGEEQFNVTTSVQITHNYFNGFWRNLPINLAGATPLEIRATCEYDVIARNPIGQ